MLLRGIIPSLLTMVYIGYVGAICNTSSCTGNNCYKNLNTKTFGFGKEYLCYTQESCKTGNNSKVPVQQIPISILENVDLIFQISDFVLPDVTLSIIQTSQYDQFEACDVSNTDTVSYTRIDNSSIQISSLGVGVHFLIFKTNHLLHSCQFGSRVQITVYQENCNFVNKTDPCQLKGQCQLNKIANRFECFCCGNFTGEHCQELDGCKLSTNPCLPNGECHDYVGGDTVPGFNCSCNEQFTGDSCNQCIQGFTGNDCRTDINECNQTLNLCNFGQCTNTNGSFECTCPVNVTGALCQTDTFNNCLSRPCDGTNRTCVDKYGSHECQCPAYYTGQNCEVKIDNCADGSCDIEGTAFCSNGIGAYNCSCNSGYAGMRL